MKVITEMSLSEFQAWSGGKETMSVLTSEQLQTIEDILVELYPEGMTDTQLNDFLWFEKDTIAYWLGYSSSEAMLGEEEEEEEEDDAEEGNDSNDEC